MSERILDWITPAILGGLFGVFGTYIKMHRKRQSANDRGTQCLLRAEIIRDHKEYSAKGYCPIYAKEALARAYDAYSELGGNDVAKEMYEHMIHLPDEPPADEERSLK